MGRAAVFDLARSGHPVLLLDADGPAAERVARRYGARRTAAFTVDAHRPESLAARLREARASAIVNCAPYTFNLSAMEAALRARCHYLDLGGLFHTTRVQLTHAEEFRRHGLLAVLGMGSAPGIVNVLARAAADSLRRVKAVRVYNGGVDHTRYEAPVAFAFSPATILDELTLPPVVFEKGRFEAREPLGGREDFAFETGVQRVHLSLHSEVATLPLTLRAKGLRECSFKIAYDPVLVERLRLLVGLGLTSRTPGAKGVAPRDVLLECFRALPPPPEFVDDRDSLAVVAVGEDAKGEVTLRYDLTARPQRKPPLSAVARDTGFPPSIVAQLLLSGRIRERGVLPPESAVPVRPFLEALAERGLRAKVTITRSA
jgi:saccharopine dehydrogenase (NAD+, L-lysine-forming)